MADSTRDHWWWRPGWRLGRSFYTWHVTFGDNSPVGSLPTLFAPVLAQIPTMQPVERTGLHVTLQGVGFVDEVPDDEIDQIVTAAAQYLGRRAPIDAEFGPVIADRETIGMPVTAPGLAEVRADVQRSIGDVWGPNRVPEREDHFGPHLSLAYSTGSAPITELQQLLDQACIAETYMPEHISSISLIELNRDKHRYEWTEVAAVPLGIR